VEITLCVLLWAREGQEQALAVYEDTVLELIAEHGGDILQRLRSAGVGDDPLEVQLFRFPSQDAFDAYMTDDRRTVLASERERVVARTHIIRVDPVNRPPASRT
jgi:uncharacterized protein (DUF1330 family)